MDQDVGVVIVGHRLAPAGGAIGDVRPAEQRVDVDDLRQLVEDCIPIAVVVCWREHGTSLYVPGGRKVTCTCAKFNAAWLYFNA